MARVQALLSYYRHACNHAANLWSDEGVHLEAGVVEAANKAKDEVSHYLHGLALSKNHSVRKDINHLLTCVSDRSSAVVEIISSVEDK